MHKNILITGGSGLVGTRLTQMLLQKGYQVSHLSRAAGDEGLVKAFQWDVENGIVDPKAFENIHAIIHLAGAGIADRPWSEKRKREILESRTHSTALLEKSLKDIPNKVEVFISASAIGYYGYAGSDHVFKEEDEPANDFLAYVVKQWEHTVDRISSLNIRVAKLRIGILLSEKGGALVELARPVRLFVGSPLGSGEQYVSWIHIDDVCAMFIHALENDLNGAYNAVAREPVTNKELTKAIAETLGRPLWLPHVPAFILKMVLGEMADLVIKGSKVSPAKIQLSGFQYRFPNLNDALRDLFEKK
ncbi:MAG: TIGR01777 family oxidoreductase [Cyclobacteriaceae bacterium]|nr:TIGR01777 family oxidoreductase [Cyclobacteriaceae bacterium]